MKKYYYQCRKDGSWEVAQLDGLDSLASCWLGRYCHIRPEKQTCFQALWDANLKVQSESVSHQLSQWIAYLEKGESVRLDIETLADLYRGFLALHTPVIDDWQGAIDEMWLPERYPILTDLRTPLLNELKDWVLTQQIPSRSLLAAYLKTSGTQLELVSIRPAADVSELPLSCLDLTVRSTNCLRRAGFTALSQVLALTDDEMDAIRYLGKKGAAEVIETRDKWQKVIEEQGLDLYTMVMTQEHIQTEITKVVPHGQIMAVAVHLYKELFYYTGSLVTGHHAYFPEKQLLGLCALGYFDYPSLRKDAHQLDCLFGEDAISSKLQEIDVLESDYMLISPTAYQTLQDHPEWLKAEAQAYLEEETQTFAARLKDLSVNRFAEEEFDRIPLSQLTDHAWEPYTLARIFHETQKQYHYFCLPYMYFEKIVDRMSNSSQTTNDELDQLFADPLLASPRTLYRYVHTHLDADYLNLDLEDD